MFSLIKPIHVIRLIYLFIYYLFVCWATLRPKPLYNLREKCEGSCVVTLLVHFFSLYSPLKTGKHTLGNTGNSEARANTEQVPRDLRCLNGEIRGAELVSGGLAGRP